MSENSTVYYRFWGSDNIAYGPVDLLELVKWIKGQRVGPENWIFREDTKEWHRGKEFPELQSLFKARSTSTPSSQGAEAIKPGALRRIKIFADLTEEQLTSFVRYIEIIKLLPHKAVFTQGEHGDAMFLVLEGEVRARVMLQGRESTLATFGVGECFGEVAILDQGPRSADVLTNAECVLLKISADALKRIFQEAPALAAPFLLGLGRTVVGRLRAVNKRYQDSIQFARASMK